MALFGNSDERIAQKERMNQLKFLISQKQDELTLISEQLARCSAILRGWMAAANRERSEKWEYLVLDDVDEGVLDDNGKAGWELVGLSSYETGFGVGGNVSTKVHMRYVFKRQIQPIDGSDVDENRAEGRRLIELQKNLQSEIEALNLSFNKPWS